MVILLLLSEKTPVTQPVFFLFFVFCIFVRNKYCCSNIFLYFLRNYKAELWRQKSFIIFFLIFLFFVFFCGPQQIHPLGAYSYIFFVIIKAKLLAAKKNFIIFSLYFSSYFRVRNKSPCSGIFLYFFFRIIKGKLLAAEKLRKNKNIKQFFSGLFFDIKKRYIDNSLPMLYNISVLTKMIETQQ